MNTDINKSKAAQLKDIKKGRGIQYILDEVYRIFGNPLLIFDMEYKLIACSASNITDDPIWNEFMKYGKLSVETIEFTKDEGFIDSVANSTMQYGVTYLISDKLKYNRIFGQLYNKNNVPVADLVAIEKGTTFTHNTPHIFKNVCDLLTKELSKSDYYMDYGQAYKENIIKKLIEGSIEDNRLYTGHVANIDNALKKNVFIGVIDIGRHNNEYTKLVELRDLLICKKPAFEHYIYNKYIITLMSWDDINCINLQTELANLCKLLKEDNICAGISSCFDNLFMLRNYYDEAVLALKHM